MFTINPEVKVPACARSQIVRLGEVALYHCWSRCVRRAFLCGEDPLTGIDYEYRRHWIREFLQQLAALFGIEIAFHAEMSNHLHLVLRTRPDVVQSWSDEEVVVRWLTVSHLTKSRDGRPREFGDARVAMELAQPGRVKELRERLANPSYLIAALCEYTARRSNTEDDCQGAFWEDRFKCRELADEASLLVCGVYVDLNQIRAGEAMTPETSTHTSAHDRIQARQQQRDQHRRASDVPSQPAPDGWLCELTIDERARPDSESTRRSKSTRRASDKGLLPITIDDYLAVLDASGRLLRPGKRGAIPAHVIPILERLGIQTKLWHELIEHFDDWFGHVVGSSQTLIDRARQNGRHWYRGKSHCAAAFGTTAG